MATIVLPLCQVMKSPLKQMYKKPLFSLFSLVFVLFSFFNSNHLNAQAVGDFGTIASGSWTNASTWGVWNGSAFVFSGTFPNNPTDNAFINTGHTVDLSVSQTPCNNLTISTGGKLWTNSAGSNTYLYVYGNITCNGTIGNGTTFDAISFGIEGASCLFTGTGNVDCSRIRKNTTTNFTTDLTIDININLRFATGSQTQIYNSANSSIFNVTVNAGKTLNLTGNAGNVGNVAMDGIAGNDGAERGGTYTIFGRLFISGNLYLTTNNTSLPCTFIIKTGGTVQTYFIIANASGSATHSLTMESGGLLQILGTPYTNPFTLSNNNYTLKPGSTIEYNAAGTQLIDNNITYANLRLAGMNTPPFSSVTVAEPAGSFTITVSSIVALGIGMGVTGTGIGVGAQIQSINNLTNTLTLTVPHSATVPFGTVLTFNGNTYATKTTSGNLNVAGNLAIVTQGIFVPANLSSVNLGGNWSSYGTNGFTEGTSTINLNGSADQIISVIGGEDFYGLSTNKSGGKVLPASAVILRIKNLLTLNWGIITTSNNNYVLVQSSATVTGANDNSFVEGPCGRQGNTAFTFPVGKIAKYRPIGISAPPNTTNLYLAEYFKVNPATIPTNLNSKDATLDHISQCEYWTLRSSTTSTLTITLSWDNLYSCGVTSLPNLRVTYWLTASTIWKDQGNLTTTGTTSAGTITAQTSNSINTVNQFFTLSSVNTSNPLPVALLNFNAYPVNKEVRLDWSTATEVNNDHFEVLRSKDGISFERIAVVEGGGNSSQTLFYQTMDPAPLSGLSYYRLKQVDFDGHSAYSAIVPVRFSQKNTFTLYPNPATDHLSLLFSEISDKESRILRFLNYAGQQVFEMKLLPFSGNSIELPIGNLPAGIYITEMITSEGDVERALFTKQ